jgi:hypothetical protein
MLGFDPRTIHMEREVDRVALGQSFLRVFNFPFFSCYFVSSSLFIHHPEMLAVLSLVDAIRRDFLVDAIRRDLLVDAVRRDLLVDAIRRDLLVDAIRRDLSHTQSENTNKKISWRSWTRIQQEAEWKQLRASSSPSPMHATSVSGPNMDAIHRISDAVRNSDFRGHFFSLAGAIVTGKGPRNGARTEEDWPNMYLKIQFT